MPPLDDSAGPFEAHRALILGIAYRMLGSWSDAEDIAQEAWLRWSDSSAAEVRSPRAYLTTLTARLCLDHIKSARVRREKYVGPWLPEPVAEPTPDPVERAETISYAFLVLLETLTPTERAVFILREAFDTGYTEIAGLLELSESNCRQLFKRAKDHLAANRPRFAPEPERRQALMAAFFRASAQGDLDAIASMLKHGAVLIGDGGGKVAAAGRPIEGAAAIAKFMASLGRLAPPGLSLEWITVNGGDPALLATDGGTVVTLAICEFDGEQIRRIFMVRNPDKLRRFVRG
ncbi:MAG: RNA polymerase sigma-70 factor [Bryobacteraceae bacterium]